MKMILVLNREYFLKAVDAQATFEIDGRARATALMLHRGGAHTSGRRIE
jgi:hypothetical protein